jgi:hypothetical protein
MPSEFRMFLDNAPATTEQMDLFRAIRVDQAIGMATEAELELELTLDDTGAWTDFAQAFTQPFSRIRVEIKIDEGAFVALIDGPVIAQRVEMSAAPNDSTLTLVVQDDSVKLNQVETVAVFEELSPSDIASQLFAGAGLTPEVGTVSAGGGTLERFTVQRGTAMQLLRDLARRHGFVLQVKPGAVPGASVGVFQPLDLGVDDAPELVLVGDARNLERISIDFDGLRPFAAAASSLDAADLSVLRSEVQSPSLTALGDEAAHDLVEPATVLLARTRETETDLDGAATAAVDAASWAWSATGEVDAASYPAVLQPYGTVNLAGAGPMSGRYLVAQVTHSIDNATYRQAFTLRRNARSAAGGGPVPGGVF